MKARGFELDPVATETVTQDLETDGFGWVASLQASVSQSPATATISPPASLSGPEQDAFQTALWGLPDVPPGEDDGGCNGHATAIADSSSGVAELWVYREPIGAQVEKAYSGAEYASLQNEWQRCMAAEGFDVSGIPDMYELVEQRWQSLRNSGSTEAPAVDLELVLHAAHTRCNADLADWLDQTVRTAVTETLAGAQ